MQDALESHVLSELPPGSKLLLGVSGGIDSMVLFAVCRRYAAHQEQSIEVAHAHHNVRPGADDDLAFVQQTCAAFSVPCHTRVLDISPEDNFEAAARRARYAFLSEIAEQRGCAWICTGHTASDAVETYLMRILSNKEPRGISRKDETRRLIRPMLSCTRGDVERYAQEHGIAFREDETNTDTRFLRNRVRHELLPFLKREFSENVESVLLQRSECARVDIAAFDALVDQALSTTRQYEFGTQRWLRSLRDCLRSNPAEFRWRMVEGLFKLKLGFNLGRRHSARLLEVLLGDRQGVELPGGWLVRLRSGGLVLKRTENHGKSG